MPSFDKLWASHPGPGTRPCRFQNQCAVRMGIALEGAGIDMSGYTGRRCWYKGHSPGHIISAEELAKWLKTAGPFHQLKIYRRWRIRVTSKDFKRKRGIILIQNAYGSDGSGDHIDLWDGHLLRGGNDPNAIGVAEAIWFWEL
jgi:hypothetical protein